VTYIISALIVVILVQTWLLWRLVRMMSLMRGFDERLSRTAQGLSLLVDTSEAGFAMLGSELSKLTVTPPRKLAAKSTNRRIAGAVRRGRAVPEIAAREGLSEGEVRLRMHLADAQPSKTPERTGDRRGSVRS
jgi:hypothetical protein